MANISGLVGKCGRCAYESIKEAARLTNEKVVTRPSKKGVLIFVMGVHEVMPPYGEITDSWFRQHDVFHVEDLPKTCTCGSRILAKTTVQQREKEDKLRQSIQRLFQ